MAPPRIALYGVFGIQNIGNECTLHATLENIRAMQPDSQVFCIGAEPAAIQADYGVCAIAIDPDDAATPAPPHRRNRAAKAWRILASHAPALAADFFRMLRTIGKGTTLSITGTGVLESDTASANWLARMLLWELAARLRGGRVAFVSIGTDRANTRLSRWLIRAVLGAADYVSYRDRRSLQCMTEDGVNTRSHRVVPDLAFSLPADELPAAALPRSVPADVGVGVVDATKFPDDEHYHAYVQQLAQFIAWLLERGQRVCLLHGDGKYDGQTIDELWRELGRRGISRDDPRLRAPVLTRTRDLLREIATLDVVVASRFHNIILSLLLGRPVIALSYHSKFAALLEGFSMDHFCIELPDFDFDKLTQRFVELSSDLAARARSIAEATSKLRPALQQQYEIVFRASNEGSQR